MHNYLCRLISLAVLRLFIHPLDLIRFIVIQLLEVSSELIQKSFLRWFPLRAAWKLVR